MERVKTCCFTGHRPQQLGFAPGSAAETALKNRLAGEIVRLIEEQNVRRFISGMALGVDTWAAQTVLKLKEIYPDLTLECAVPCRNQAKRWNRRDRETYLSVLRAADRVTVLQEEYTPFCMQLRDAYMVEQADIVLAVWNGSKGGTSYTVNCARKLHKTLIVIPTIEERKGVE